MRKISKFPVGRVGFRYRLFLTGCAVGAGLLGIAAANATTIVQNTTIAATNNTVSNITTGGPITFLSIPVVFEQFDASLGTLDSATLSWTITGSENGGGNFSGTGQFNFAGQSQTVTFDTISDPGPKTFDFTGNALLGLGIVTGSGNFSELFSAAIQQSGYFPWSGSMSVDLSQVSLVYDYTAVNPVDPTPRDAPEPASWMILLTGLAMLGFAARRGLGKS